jgi:sugar lactone lactonase YvrE
MRISPAWIVVVLIGAWSIRPDGIATGAPEQAKGNSASAAEYDSMIAVVLAGTPTKSAPPVGGELDGPFGMAADGAGNFFIAEISGHRVRKLDAQGRLSTIAGTGVEGFAGDNGPALQAQFHGMHHLALAPNGDILVTDTWNNCLRKIDVHSGIITTIAGSGVKGFSGDGGPARRAQCGGLYCVAVDAPRNRLLLADLDNRRIRVVTLGDGKIDTLAGNGQAGVPADGSLAQHSPLLDPRAVACDGQGNVYILERGGHALRAVDLQGRIRTVAGTGRVGPAADDVAARAATFNGPKHLCVDGQGDVIIADTENHVIRKLLVRENRVVRVAGTGKLGSAGVGGSPRNVELNRPHGVFVDAQGAIYIVDSGNNRILKLQER